MYNTRRATTENGNSGLRALAGVWLDPSILKGEKAFTSRLRPSVKSTFEPLCWAALWASAGIRGSECFCRDFAALVDALRLQKLRELPVKTENVLVDPDLNEKR